LIDGRKIRPEDLILALPSSGVHSNGFSLVRRIFTGKLLKTWGRELIKPTRIYVEDLAKLSVSLKKRRHEILGLAHITGGGLIENVPRILPKNCRAVFNRDLWRVPAIFSEIQRRGGVSEPEMWRTFNMGIGMIAVLRPAALALALKILPGSFLAGKIIAGKTAAEIQ
jgi:phosphoribosylformylglycinamidine cyclo-ligase